LPTKDHFSSSWTLVVEGGKAHQLVVELAGVAAGAQGEAVDGVLADADQAGRLSNAAAVGEVGEDGEELVGGESGAEQGCALAVGEAAAASLTVEEAVLVGLAVAHADREVAGVAAGVVGAVGVEAAEAAEVVQGGESGEEDMLGSARLDVPAEETIQCSGDTTG
jgi:hypothetical protein